ncbi:MAG: hypothetical protein CMK32_04485 [Porticoccaceae bacterium]|nr:hypothetical protein [Porticoccaceae bacterium]
MYKGDPELLKAKLASETARICWRELQRFFAAGSVIAVAADLDLVDVAWRLAQDDAALLKDWLERGAVQPVSDQQALAWYEADAELWSVVVNPWVLVQQDPERERRTAGRGAE